MSPERIAELRRGYVEQESGFHFRGASRDEIGDLLATAEHRDMLAEAVRLYLDAVDSHGVEPDGLVVFARKTMRAALGQQGATNAD